MSDILVNKTIETMGAFQEEFKHLLPDEISTMFYVKTQDNTIFPFKGIAFSNTGQVRVKALLQNDSFTWVILKESDSIYFTNNIINLTSYRSTVTELSSRYNIINDYGSIGSIPYSFQ